MPKYRKNFWVYENYINKHAFIHVPCCPHCKDGKGQSKSKEPPGHRYQWKGCNSYEDALKILEEYKNEYLNGESEERKKELARDCGTCKPCNKHFWYMD